MVRKSLGEGIRFGLYGIWGVHNYGTESIIRGTETILRYFWPKSQVVYISPRYEEDKNRLAGLNIILRKRILAQRWSQRWFINGFLRRMGLGSLYPWEDTLWVEDVDCILSIGGDLYTIPEKLYLKESTFFYSNNLIDFGEWVTHRGVPYVVWGASIGPFDNHPKAKSAYLNHLRKVNLITVREPVTYDYLKKQGGFNNMKLVADPAFLTELGEYKTIDKVESTPLIGINLSPLSVRHSYPGVSMVEIISLLAESTRRLATALNADIVLLPHVFDRKNSGDDDATFLEKIKNKLDKVSDTNVKIISDDPGARKMKHILRQCDVVLSTRMHCGIHAASVGTPVVFISYSTKSYGMSQYIYGSDEYVIRLADYGTDDCIRLVRNILLDNDGIRMMLEKKKNKFMEDAIAGGEYLAGLVL